MWSSIGRLLRWSCAMRSWQNSKWRASTTTRLTTGLFPCFCLRTKKLRCLHYPLRSKLWSSWIKRRSRGSWSLKMKKSTVTRVATALAWRPKIKRATAICLSMRLLKILDKVAEKTQPHLTTRKWQPRHVLTDLIFLLTVRIQFHLIMLQASGWAKTTCAEAPTLVIIITPTRKRTSWGLVQTRY